MHSQSFAPRHPLQAFRLPRAHRPVSVRRPATVAEAQLRASALSRLLAFFASSRLDWATGGRGIGDH